jgi:predicted nucleotidyltransferase
MLRPARRGTGLGIEELVAPKRRELFRALENHRARNPRVFGSVARREATRKSDLDLLVDFDEGASAFDQMGLISDLEELFSRHVDVAEPGGIHWLVRPQILFEAIRL